MDNIRFRIEGDSDWVEFEFRGPVDESDPVLTGWIWVWIRAHIDCFQASIPGRFFIGEMVQFRAGLKTVHESMSGVARLESVEGWATIDVTIEPNGGLTVTGSLGSPDRPDVRLVYGIRSLDQTHLPGWIATLAQVEAAYA